jgi:hypothetical protein
MRARVVEIEPEKGFGKALLASGETLTFDVAVSVLGVPVVGAELEIEVGPSRAGGLRVTRAEIIPWWEPTTLPCICLRERGGSRAELLYIDKRSSSSSSQAFRTDQPMPTDGRSNVGTCGQLVLERKRGAANFFETRVVGWSVAEVDAATRLNLLSAYRELLVEAWETWEDADGSHTAEDLEALKADLFAGLDLGLDVDDLLTITDYPIEPQQPHYVHDRRAFSPPRASVDGKIRLTRTA